MSRYLRKRGVGVEVLACISPQTGSDAPLEQPVPGETLLRGASEKEVDTTEAQERCSVPCLEFMRLEELVESDSASESLPEFPYSGDDGKAADTNVAVSKPDLHYTWVQGMADQVLR